MKIIVVGGGKVGYSIAKQLSAENHHLTIIDKLDRPLARAEETLNTLCLKGSGASIETLHEAGVRSAELLVAVTAEDELNMVCCLMAKKLGVRHTVARIRDPEYSREASLLQEQIGLDRVINPELAAAREISRLVRFPDATHIDAFARGRVEMIGFRVQEHDGIADTPLSVLSAKMPKNLLFCAIDRDGELIIPRGDDCLRVGDDAYIMADRTSSSKLFRAMGRKHMRAHDVMIAGGGRLSVYLARRLDSVGIRVIIIEIDEEKSRALSAALPFATVVCGDATDVETLTAENAAGMDYFIAATDRDEENIFAALTAQKLGARRTIVKVNKNDYSDMLHRVGLECSIAPKDIAASIIVRYVRGIANSAGSNSIITLYKIMNGQAETMELRADGHTAFLGVPLKDVRIKRGLLLCAIVRRGELVIPRGDDMVKEGDHVIVIASGCTLGDINDILER